MDRKSGRKNPLQTAEGNIIFLPDFFNGKTQKKRVFRTENREKCRKNTVTRQKDARKEIPLPYSEDPYFSVLTYLSTYLRMESAQIRYPTARGWSRSPIMVRERYPPGESM